MRPKRRCRRCLGGINHQDFTFSPGKHNELQKAIIEEFAPRFAPNSECLYVGDTIQKDLVKNVEKLSDLGFEITLHDKMPDVVLYREDKNWIYFIESITSVGSNGSQANSRNRSNDTQCHCWENIHFRIP